MAWDAQPAYSPDGKLLAHLAMERPGFEADRFRLVVRDAATGAIRFTTADWDRSVAAFQFSTDNRSVYAVADDLGQRPLWSIDLGNGSRTALTQPGNVTEFDVAGPRIVFATQNLSAPSDFYLMAEGAQARRLTDVNASRLANVRWGEADSSVRGAGGDIFGYVMSSGMERAALSLPSRARGPP